MFGVPYDEVSQIPRALKPPKKLNPRDILKIPPNFLQNIRLLVSFLNSTYFMTDQMVNWLTKHVIRVVPNNGTQQYPDR